ncbi:MAG: hypothetical protein JHD16_01255 [Solirubrobacteraceae bacterium]|nr:hypothetical protein [Solirubrobacteraceae bacterium]
MTAPSTPPRSASYSSATIFASGFGLLLLLALLGVLSLVVRDANADALQDKVVPGKIGVIGAAKVRTWESKGFDVQIPAGWGNIATGPVELANTGDLARLTPTQRAARERTFAARRLVVHRWQGTLDAQPGETECRLGTICAEIQVEQGYGRRDRTVKKFATERVTEYADDKNLRFIDLGPVTARGGRWVWRWSARLGDQERTAYFFATCQGGRVAQYYQVILRAPAAANVEDQFADLLASVQTDLPSQPRGERGRDRDCSDVVDQE